MTCNCQKPIGSCQNETCFSKHSTCYHSWSACPLQPMSWLRALPVGLFVNFPCLPPSGSAHSGLLQDLALILWTAGLPRSCHNLWPAWHPQKSRLMPFSPYQWLTYACWSLTSKIDVPEPSLNHSLKSQILFRLTVLQAQYYRFCPAGNRCQFLLAPLRLRFI